MIGFKSQSSMMIGSMPQQNSESALKLLQEYPLLAATAQAKL